MKLAFYKSNHHGLPGLFDRLTRFWTRGRYSHVEAVIQEYEGSAICISSSWRDGGVRSKIIDLSPEKWDVIEVPDVPLSRLNTWLMKNSGKKYDTLGLLGFAFRPIEGDQNRFFCSEAVADLLGIPEPWRYDPNTLYTTITYMAATQRP